MGCAFLIHYVIEQLLPKKQKETVTRKKTRVQPLKFTGAIGASRTRDPLLRRQMLYPTELQPQV